jgi:lipopolysaccharide/colanic/teichoic acid biosynthesis glycosyltransferase
MDFVEIISAADQVICSTNDGADTTSLRLRPVFSCFKVFFDVLFASILIVTLSPVFLVIFILVKLDGGPAFFSHIRVGKDRRYFRCFKFRSMIVNGDAILKAELESDPRASAEWLKMRKLRNDPRVTKIGRFLRATSLDEIPQLMNVIRLEMSFVGPRPIIEAEVDLYGADIEFYYKTRPGITGLWQVSGRSDVSFSERVRLDVQYVECWSFLSDCLILARTIPAVMGRKGAC